MAPTPSCALCRPAWRALLTTAVALVATVARAEVTSDPAVRTDEVARASRLGLTLRIDLDAVPEPPACGPLAQLHVAAQAFLSDVEPFSWRDPRVRQRADTFARLAAACEACAPLMLTHHARCPRQPLDIRVART